MPYVFVSLPYGGINIDSGYSSLPAGFTSDCINIMPFDPYKGKLRLGQRRALCGGFEFNDTTPSVITREVQTIVRADAYVNGVLLQRCIVVAGGEVFIIDPGSLNPYKVSYAASTSKLKSTGNVSVAVVGEYAYFADGEKYRRMKITLETPTVEFWGTTLSNVTVQTTTGRFRCTANNLAVGDAIAVTGAFPTGAGGGNIAEYLHQEMFYVKSIPSTSPYEFVLTRDPDVATGAAVSTTVGTGSTSGVSFITSGPEMTVKPSAISIGYVGVESGARAALLVRFGGRLALSGLESSSNNWFLSELNDPNNWLPGATSNTAVAGSLSTKYGVPGEPITALIPVGESGLLMAGSHTMTYLNADPVVTDARMIELSRSVGIVSARAWCASDSQTIYVMAQDGLYRVQPNDYQITKSNRITTARLDTYFQQQKFDQLNCVLGYDAEAQNVYCMMSRIDLPSASVHILYSQATNSFWPIKTSWTSFQAPTCCGDFPFGDARAPILAFGSTDGFLGWFDRDLTSGIDGQAATGYKTATVFDPTAEVAANQRVVSKLLFGPVLSQEVARVMVKDVRIELTMDQPAEKLIYQPVVSGPFLYALAGETAEEAVGENIISVSVQFDPDYPMLTLDAGFAAPFTQDSTQICGDAAGTSPAGNYGIDLFGASPIAPATYTSADALIADPTARTYDYKSLEVYNTTASSGLTDWVIRDTAGSYKTLMTRDEALADTSADTPGGRYRYTPPSFTTFPGMTIPPQFVTPRLVVSSATYDNTNSTLLGTLTYGRNDSQRCRISDQAVYMRIESLGVPWAIERMSVLVEATKFNRNVKGTY